MIKSIKYLLGLTFLFACSFLYGQRSNFNSQDNWSLNKREIIFGFGGTQFLGDLGGKDQIGRDYSLADLDLPSTSLGGMIGYRYRFHQYFATTTSFNIGLLKGDDALTNEIIRESRNLHFRSIIIDLSQRLEVIVLAHEKVGSRYNLSGHRKRAKNHNKQMYLFGGVGIAYFNPKAKYNDEWVALRPLKTEGQGLPGGAEKNSPVSLIIPMGIGVRWGLSQLWRMGLEATYTMTFSDYVDDVHDIYYDRDLLAAQVGVEAAYLSNPSVQNSTWFAAGQQRGDKDENDAYFYLNLTFIRNVTYKDYSKQRKMHRWKGRYKF
tara:strand:+ start:2684 stop:3643 length:960 start_codon:yes stop_codon:yes gene_type:complete